MFLAIKTDQDPTEIYLLDSAGEILEQKVWRAERRLARDLLGEVEQLVIASAAKQSTDEMTGLPRQASLPCNDNTWDDLTGIIVFSGPGSFTGLRIGITTANAIAYSNKIPIVGASGDDWIIDGMKKLNENKDDKIVLPEYGAPATITKPKNVVK